MIKHWTYLFKEAFTKEECEWIISLAEQLPAVTGTIGHGGVQTVNSAIRTSEVKWFKRADIRFMELFYKLQVLAEQANLRSFNFKLSGFLDVQFTKYEAPNGHYDWHEDNNWTDGEPCTRKLSMVLQLSDPTTYEGGRLELSRGYGIQELSQGSVIFFPSFLSHRVIPMISGVRYSLVTWFMGPQWE